MYYHRGFILRRSSARWSAVCMHWPYRERKHNLCARSPAAYIAHRFCTRALCVVCASCTCMFALAMLRIFLIPRPFLGTAGSCAPSDIRGCGPQRCVSVPIIIMQQKARILNDGILICEHSQRAGVFGPLITTAASYEYARDDRFARETHKNAHRTAKNAKGR